MKIIQCDQGTPEWYAARKGIPSASEFDKIVTTKGEPSKQAKKYMYRLAGELVSGSIEETYQNGAMERGKIMEAEARRLYEMATGHTVNQVGFCVSEGDHVFGCSPDGLVGEDGGLEIKCPSMAVHVEYLINNTVPTEYFQQVQGNLFVTGRKWWSFVSYYPALPPLIITVDPDLSFIGSLNLEMRKFCEELNKTVKYMEGL